MEELMNILSQILPDIDFGKEKNLVDDGLLDSVTMVNIISEIEEAFGISVSMEYIQPKYFQSAEAIWEMIGELQ